MGNSCKKTEDSNTPVMNPTSEKPEIIRKTSTAAIVKDEPVGDSSPKILSRPQTSSKTVSDIEKSATADSKTDSLGPSRPQTSSKNVSDIDSTAEIKPLSPSPSKPCVNSLSASISSPSITSLPPFLFINSLSLNSLHFSI